MSRISSLAANEQLVKQMLLLQERIHKTQIQATSEKVSQDYKGVAKQSEYLISIENARDQLDQYKTNNELMDLQLKVTDKTLDGIKKTITDFRSALADFALGSMTNEQRVEDIQDSAYRALKDMETHMNTDVNGQYLFSGDRNSTKPVDFGLTSLAALQTKWDGSTVSYPTYRDNHVHPKLTASTGFPSNPTGAGFTNLSFTAGAGGTITSAVTGAFANIPVGATITVANASSATNNGTFTVAANTGTVITVSAADTLALGTNDTGTAANITMTTNISYYNGDELTQTHRVSKDRSFDLDLNGINPAFEKAIRAMHIIAQGDFGTAGGLDQNTGRVDDAYYLLSSSLVPNPGGPAPYGTELTNNLEVTFLDYGYHRVLIDKTNEYNKDLISFYDERVADTENVDPLEVVSRLLDDERALESSYQVIARIRSLSLSDFI